MNCCDDNGRCTGGKGCVARSGRSCDELGVCQERRPACGGCITRHDTGPMMETAFAHGPLLAPGAVEGYRIPLLGSRRQRRELKRWLEVAALLGAGLGLVGFVAGLVAGALK